MVLIRSTKQAQSINNVDSKSGSLYKKVGENVDEHWARLIL